MTYCREIEENCIPVYFTPICLLKQNIYRNSIKESTCCSFYYRTSGSTTVVSLVVEAQIKHFFVVGDQDTAWEDSGESYSYTIHNMHAACMLQNMSITRAHVKYSCTRYSSVYSTTTDRYRYFT